MSFFARSVALALAALSATPSSQAAATVQRVLLQPAAVGPAAARETNAPRVDLTITDHGWSTSIHASVMVACDPATAWKVLTDYDRYASFIPSVETSRVVARDGAQVVVELIVRAPP